MAGGPLSSLSPPQSRLAPPPIGKKDDLAPPSPASRRPHPQRTLLFLVPGTLHTDHPFGDLFPFTHHTVEVSVLVVYFLRVRRLRRVSPAGKLQSFRQRAPRLRACEGRCVGPHAKPLPSLRLRPSARRALAGGCARLPAAPRAALAPPALSPLGACPGVGGPPGSRAGQRGKAAERAAGWRRGGGGEMPGAARGVRRGVRGAHVRRRLGQLHRGGLAVGRLYS